MLELTDSVAFTHRPDAWLKRLGDVVLCAGGLLVLAPLMLVTAGLVWLSDRGPVFYRQTRIGRDGRPFTMWKFRSMYVDADKRGTLVTIGDDPRITPVGRWLRRTKIDELPQLINVVRGEMSLVGPRPEVERYVAHYPPELHAVLALTPGITDPASVKYRDEQELLAGQEDPEGYYIRTVLPDKLRINLEYARHATVWTDLLVVLQTLLRIAR